MRTKFPNGSGSGYPLFSVSFGGGLEKGKSEEEEDEVGTIRYL